MRGIERAGDTEFRPLRFAKRIDDKAIRAGMPGFVDMTSGLTPRRPDLWSVQPTA
jgi:hypothetical protein